VVPARASAVVVPAWASAASHLLGGARGTRPGRLEKPLPTC